MELSTNKVTFKKPLSPSKLIKIEELSLIKIKLSYGGGMGGSNVNLYIEEIKSESENELIVKTFDNEVITINKRFMVFRKPIKAILHITDTTEHSNYNAKVVNSSTLTHLYELSVNTDWEFEENSVASENSIQPFYRHLEKN